MALKKSKREEQAKRDDLTGEHAVGDAGQVILVCLFAGTWILDTFFLKYTTSLNQFIPLVARISLGLVILILSGYLARTSLSIVFGETRETPCVIRKGVFNVVRHPMYLSEILLYLGFLVMSISIVALFVWIIAILFLYIISQHEEKLLVARFGKDYEQYMREVPMLIPWFRKK